MFARGSFNGWADPPPPGDAFANLGGDVYEARVQLAAGEQAYKVASADWSSQWSYQDGTTPLDEEVVMANADGEDTNGALTVDETGCYTWTMDANPRRSFPKMTGQEIPSKSRPPGPGNLSAAWSRSTTIRQATGRDTVSSEIRPTPRASMIPRSLCGQESMTSPSATARSTRSSAISPAPSAMSSSASVLFPEPESPVIRQPLPEMDTALAWICSLATVTRAVQRGSAHPS